MPGNIGFQLSDPLPACLDGIKLCGQFLSQLGQFLGAHIMLAGQSAQIEQTNLDGIETFGIET